MLKQTSRLILFYCLLTFSLLGCTSPLKREDVLVSVQDLTPTIRVEMKYLTYDNFLGRPVVGYENNICYLSHSAAHALARVQARLEKRDYALKVHDCFRPVRAVQDFVRWGQDLSDQSTKAQYYPDLDKSKLFELGYISNRSGHSRASTIDLTIVKVEKGLDRNVDMGSGFDFFGEISHTDTPLITVAQKANRQILKAAMEAEGFQNYSKEWWHYTLKNEPHPDQYFDFIID